MANIIPVYFFFLAVIFRIEKLDFRRSSRQAKTLGAILAVTGAFTVALSKGLFLLVHSSNSNSPDHHQLLLSQQSKWIIGGFLLVSTCILSALWNDLQLATVKEYPEEITIAFFHSFFITTQAPFFSVITESNLNAWKLKTNVEIMAIVCMAIYGSVFRIAIHTWWLQRKGPVYIAMFKPLGMAIAVILTVIFVGYTLYLGSVMWGQMKEKKNIAVNIEHGRLKNKHWTLHPATSSVLAYF